MPNSARADYTLTYALCEEHFKRQGFVVWSEIARHLNISRQAVLTRLQTGVRTGQITQADLDRWRSTSSRHKASEARRKASRAAESLQMTFTLTPENKAWLTTESSVRGARPADILNGLINLARLQPPSTP
jgi:hypothetical protein